MTGLLGQPYWHVLMPMNFFAWPSCLCQSLYVAGGGLQVTHPRIEDELACKAPCHKLSCLPAGVSRVNSNSLWQTKDAWCTDKCKQATWKGLELTFCSHGPWSAAGIPLQVDRTETRPLPRYRVH